MVFGKMPARKEQAIGKGRSEDGRIQIISVDRSASKGFRFKEINSPDRKCQQMRSVDNSLWAIAYRQKYY